MPPGIALRFALDVYRILGEYRRCVKQGAMMFAAIEAMAEANPVWPPHGHKPHITA